MGVGNIEDVYGLSQTQYGMLFAALYSPELPVYFEQTVMTHKDLDVPNFVHAWRKVVERHPVLRTAFFWEDLDEPSQVVMREVELPVEQLDWRALDRDEQEVWLETFLEADRRRGFDLSEAPLMRLALIRVDGMTYDVVLSCHHVLFDGWSGILLDQEVWAWYEAFRGGQTLDLPQPRPFRDYISWLRKKDWGTEKAFWQEKLEGFTVATLLSIDAAPGDLLNPKAAFSKQETRLSPETSAAVQTFALQHRTTVNVLVQAAWALLLNRYSGEEDVTFGVTVHGRPSDLDGFESMVGLFINAIPVRVQVLPTASVLDWLNGLQAEIAELLRYGHAPLVEIQSWNGIPRNKPMFDYVLVDQTDPRDTPDDQDTGSHILFETTDYPLTVYMDWVDDALRLRTTYDCQRFDDDAITRMLYHLRTLLVGMIADPHQPLAQLPLLTFDERQQILCDWNDTAAPYPKTTTLHQLFEAQAARTPKATAVTLGGGRLTYAELNSRANQLAHHLRARGVRPGTRVGLCVERSLDMVVSLLGILKAGGAYVPLDPVYPDQRLAFMLEDAQVKLLLTQAELLSGLPQVDVPVLCLDRDWDAIAQENTDDPEDVTEPNHLAYVIYTSGSTGRPKGVMISHQALVQYVTAAIGHFAITSDDRLLQFGSISFDTAAEEIYSCLLGGGTLVLHTDAMLDSVEAFLQACAAEGITVLDLPTAYWHAIVAQLEASTPTFPPSLRLVIIGGEAASPERLKTWQAHAPAHVQLVNTYGPTEATIVATMCDLTGEGAPESAPKAPIGKPVANTRVYVLDSHLRPVPVGVPGELCIGGDDLARGYLNRPGLTAAAFVPDPFPRRAGKTEGGTRLYRTGDLVRYLPDGNIEFLGRIDHQVKVRGFRVELGEVEVVLIQHPVVRETVVLAWEDGPGVRRLVAYVVPSEGQELMASDLRRFLQERLPDHMVPSTFVVLEAMPLTPGGKVDRRALPGPDGSRPELEGAFVAPRTPTEEALAGIWAELLGLERVGVHDNFFELGGDSILSVHIIARANQAGLHLIPRDLFQHPTVERLAAVAGRADQGPVVQVEQGVVEGPVPLTPIQRWFFEQNLPEPHRWSQALLLEVRERLESETMGQAVAALLAHHDALRLRFTQNELGWEQVNAGLESRVPFAQVDLSAMPEAEQETAIAARAAELQASLNLGEGPLVQVACFDLGEGRPGRLLLVVHRLAVDGMSWRILLEDLQAACEQLRRGEEVVLPPKTASFQHWAQQLVEYAQLEEVEEELAYWLVVGEGEMTQLPMDYERGESAEEAVRSVMVELDEDETRALLTEVSAAYGAEIGDALLTALSQAFAQWAGSQALLMDLEGPGRGGLFEDVDLSRTVGRLTNLFPVRLDLGEMWGPGEALMVVKEQLRAIPKQGIGYGLLRYLQGDEETGDRLRALPQAEVSFSYLGQLDQVLDEESPFGSHLDLWESQERRSHSLNISGVIVEGRLQVDWRYSEATCRRETVEHVAGAFIGALRAITAHCQSPEAVGYTPSDFPDLDLSQEEIEALVAEIGGSL